MKMHLLGICSFLALLPSSQAPAEPKEQRLAFGSTPSWIVGDQPALIEITGPAAGIGPLSCSLFPNSPQDARKTYLLAPLEKSDSAVVKLALQAPWRMLLLPPSPGDLQAREITLRGIDLEIRHEPVKMETSCGSCGHHGPAILTETALGTVYLPLKMEKGLQTTPPPSRVRFQ